MTTCRMYWRDTIAGVGFEGPAEAACNALISEIRRKLIVGK